MDIEVLAVMIPIIAIVFASLLAFSYLLFRHLRRRRVVEVFHEQRMAAISKGVEMPPFPEGLLESGPQMPGPGRALFRGLLWSLVGLALLLALHQLHQGIWLLALIPIGVGVAYLAYYWIETKKAPLAPTDTDDGAPPLPETVKP
ncbi:MAG: DUF6249 domain-containing protein [Verrucomicrobiia bacterium]